MTSNRPVTYVVIFNVLMVFFLFISSQYVLSVIEQRGEVVGEIGIIIDTHYAGPIEYTPTYARNDLLNYPLIIFTLALLGNAILILQLRRENKADLRSKNSF